VGAKKGDIATTAAAAAIQFLRCMGAPDLN